MDVRVAWHGALYGHTTNGPIVLDARAGTDLEAQPGLIPFLVSARYAIGDTELQYPETVIAPAAG
jgi:hypothetical protein